MHNFCNVTAKSSFVTPEEPWPPERWLQMRPSHGAVLELLPPLASRSSNHDRTFPRMPDTFPGRSSRLGLASGNKNSRGYGFTPLLLLLLLYTRTRVRETPNTTTHALWQCGMTVGVRGEDRGVRCVPAYRFGAWGSMLGSCGIDHQVLFSGCLQSNAPLAAQPVFTTTTMDILRNGLATRRPETVLDARGTR